MGSDVRVRDEPGRPSPDELWLMEAVYQRWRETGQWPLIDDLQHAVDLSGDTTDVDAIADRLDRRYGHRNRGQRETLELTICGVAACSSSPQDLADALLAGRFAYSRYLDLFSREVGDTRGALSR